MSRNVLTATNDRPHEAPSGQRAEPMGASEQASSQLRNPPLQEAMLEVRWPVSEDPNHRLPGDPKYKILLGRISDRAAAEFGVPESLAFASMPDSLATGNVQFRWTSKTTEGLLLQLGPGVFTVNHVAPREYVWESYRDASAKWVRELAISSGLSTADTFVAERVALRYINSIPVDFKDGTSSYDFLRERLHIAIEPHTIFPSDRVASTPQTFQYQSSFMCSAPLGRITLAVAHVHVPEQRLLFQLLFESIGTEHVPAIPARLLQWLEEAHYVIDSTFRNMIRGDLEREFA